MKLPGRIFSNSIERKIFIILCVLFVCFIGIGNIILRQIYFSTSTNTIQNVMNIVRQDISYKNGKWDTLLYNTDPRVPDNNSVYVVNTDGFVIERWRPVHGLLDVSDYKRLLIYQQPQTISTLANEKWRVLSKPIISNNRTVGAIFVSFFAPPENDTSTIDSQLNDGISYIASKIKIKNRDIDTNSLDIRKIPINISFQIVNLFNKLILQSDNTNSITRSPSFIDSSYVDQELNQNGIRQVQDTETHENYLVSSAPIVDQTNSPVGVVVVARSIQEMYSVLNPFIIGLIISGFILVPIAFFIIKRLLQSYTKGVVQKHKNMNAVKQTVESLSFDKKKSALIINETQIQIPYATNQYYLCDLLFSKPQKRWEVDEILEKFGEEIKAENARKIYDTMLALNKKFHSVVSENIIEYQDKIYRINPSVTPKIS